MRDRFGIAPEPNLDRNADEADPAIAGVRPIELITGDGGRRRWPGDDQARIAVENFAPGTNVSEVVRHKGLNR